MSRHVGSQARYRAGCRCPGCKRAHAGYVRDWRAGRVQARVDAGPVRAHLQRLIASGLLQSYLADEAGVPRTTVHDLLHSSRSTSPAIADALLALRPLDVEAALPARVALADSTGSRSGRRGVVGSLDLRAGSARDAAAALGVSARTVARWRARQASARRSA